MCYICGRGSCMPSFHSIEEQEAFSAVEEAYENYLEVRDKCRDDWNSREIEDDE